MALREGTAVVEEEVNRGGAMSLANALTAQYADMRENSVIESGDFRLDLETKVATLQGRCIDLTADEFDLLHYLISHHRKLVTPTTVLSTPSTDSAVVQYATGRHRPNYRHSESEPDLPDQQPGIAGDRRCWPVRPDREPAG